MTGQAQVEGADAGALLLGVDLQSLDVDSLLGPLASRGSRSLGFRQRPPRVGVEGLRADEVISAQKKALEQPAPTQAVKAKAANCLAHGPALVGGKCGERMFFIVTTVTSDGQVMKEGGASVTCIVTGRSLMSKTQPEPRPFVEDRQDGTYHIQFVCATPGVYEIAACVDGVALPMCPIAVSVAPGPPSATTTQVRGDGSQRCTLGGSAEFTIQAMDEFGNLCGEGGARFGVRASAHVRLHEVSDNEDGTYTVTYSIPDWAQGPVKLEVLLDGHPIRGSPLMPRIIGYVPDKGVEPKAKAQGRVQKGAGGTFTDQLPPEPQLKPRAFLGASIDVHLEQCVRKWEDIQLQKPRQHRESVPECPNLTPEMTQTDFNRAVRARFQRRCHHCGKSAGHLPELRAFLSPTMPCCSNT
ncbi:abpC [Symbiodinium natans]|uniref:AbpC protein n=1 Tax=Symbiodinium natans TaxID=878477 RepID=A0A812SHP7_9DINO|nr:abpC [Symbiodinium natans]